MINCLRRKKWFESICRCNKSASIICYYFLTAQSFVWSESLLDESRDWSAWAKGLELKANNFMKTEMKPLNNPCLSDFGPTNDEANKRVKDDEFIGKYCMFRQSHHLRLVQLYLIPWARYQRRKWTFARKDSSAKVWWTFRVSRGEVSHPPIGTPH